MYLSGKFEKTNDTHSLCHCLKFWVCLLSSYRAELLAKQSENKFRIWTRSVLNVTASSTYASSKGEEPGGVAGQTLALPTAVPAIVMQNWPGEAEEEEEVIGSLTAVNE